MTKYGNKKTEYKGETYDSKKEADYAKMLDTLRFAANPKDRVIGSDRQVRFPVEIEGSKICVYIADFRVRYADGREEIVDVKGVRTAVYILKKKLVEAIYKIKIIEI